MLDKYVYCLSCKATFENKVELILKNMGYTVISALAERKIIVKETVVDELRSVIPGYVFFENDNVLDVLCWKEICKKDNVFFPLKYPDNEKALRGKDLEFINWLKANNGIIKLSKVIEIGTKIQPIEGPLKELDGKIVKINRRQKCAGIKLEGEGINGIIWLSYEYV
jgi:transcriptional antiterminator NusG